MGLDPSVAIQSLQSKDPVRELLVIQSCTVLHRGAIGATGAPANRLI